MLNQEPRGRCDREAVDGKTPEGVPDLQGYWTNNSYTPLQRDANMTKEFFTKEELVADEKRRAAQQEEQTVPGTTADVHYDFTQFALDRSQTRLTGNLRTSIIVDPPNGRLPRARRRRRRGRRRPRWRWRWRWCEVVPVRRPLPVRRLLPVVEEVRVVVLLQQRRWRWCQRRRRLVAAAVAVVAIPHTTRCRTSRSDRGASGPTAPHRS